MSPHTDWQSEKETMYQSAGRLMALALRMNHETNLAVFVNFSGHVRQLEVHICTDKQNYTDEICRMVVHFDGTALQNANKIETVIDLLNEMLTFDTTNIRALRTICDQHPATDVTY